MRIFFHLRDLGKDVPDSDSFIQEIFIELGRYKRSAILNSLSHLKVKYNETYRFNSDFYSHIEQIIKDGNNTPTPPQSVPAKMKLSTKDKFRTHTDTNAKRGFTETALYQASKNGLTNKVKQILSTGVDVNDRSSYGLTALYAAAKEGHREIVKLCIDYGGEVNVTDASGKTPLQKASENGHTGIVNLLRAHGGEAHIIKNKQGCFVATAVFNSSEHPTVRELRMIRDTVFEKTNLGRLIIRIYYVIGPPTARVVNAIPFTKKILTPVLNLIAKLAIRYSIRHAPT